MAEEETRDDIIDIINNEESVKEEHIKDEVKETILEEGIKPKTKPRASRAKPKQIKIVKESIEPVEPVVEEKPQPVVEVVEEKPKK